MKRDNQVLKELKRLTATQLLERIAGVESELQAFKEEMRTQMGSLAVMSANIYEKVGKEEPVEAN